MKPSPTGNGIRVVIRSGGEIADDWLAFLSWYSWHVAWPEAEFAVEAPRRNGDVMLYHWLYRADVRRGCRDPHLLLTRPLVLVRPDMLDLSDPAEDVLAALFWLGGGKKIVPVGTTADPAATTVVDPCRKLGRLDLDEYAKKHRVPPFGDPVPPMFDTPNERGLLSLLPRAAAAYAAVA